MLKSSLFTHSYIYGECNRNAHWPMTCTNRVNVKDDKDILVRRSVQKSYNFCGQRIFDLIQNLLPIFHAHICFKYDVFMHGTGL